MNKSATLAKDIIRRSWKHIYPLHLRDEEMKTKTTH